jgi:hypothetical protein
MLLTEEEAKTKWCPFVRQNGDNNRPSGNRSIYGEPMCIASQCMAWRWAQQYAREGFKWNPLSERRTTNNQEDGMPLPPDGNGWEIYSAGITRTAWIRRMTPKMGFCGLAGKADE